MEWFEIAGIAVLSLVVLLFIGFVVLACCSRKQIKQVVKEEEEAVASVSTRVPSGTSVQATPSASVIDTMPAPGPPAAPVPASNRSSQHQQNGVIPSQQQPLNPARLETRVPYPVTPASPPPPPVVQQGPSSTIILQEIDAVYEDRLEQDGVLLPSKYRAPVVQKKAASDMALVYDRNRARHSRMYPTPDTRGLHQPMSPVRSENIYSPRPSMDPDPYSMRPVYMDGVPISRKPTMTRPSDIKPYKGGLYSYERPTADEFYSPPDPVDNFYTGGRAVSETNALGGYNPRNFSNFYDPEPLRRPSIPMQRSESFDRGATEFRRGVFTFDRGAPRYSSYQPNHFQMGRPGSPEHMARGSFPPPPPPALPSPQANPIDYHPLSTGQFYPAGGLPSPQPVRQTYRPPPLVMPDADVPISPSPLSPEQLKLHELRTRHTKPGQQPFTYLPQGARL